MDAKQRLRYARHLTLPGIGTEGQEKLLASRVLVIGAGGLGSPILNYLAAAGVGHITVLDDDIVEESNLQRQTIHSEAAIGTPKVDSAVAFVRALNSGITIDGRRERLTPDNALRLFEEHDVVIDGTDNFATRYLSNDAAELTGTPLVWATIMQFSGQISVFWPGHGPMLRDIFPDIPPASSVPSCAAGGVLGALAGQIGSMMVIEAIKVLTGAGTPLTGRLLLIDALNCTQRVLTFEADPSRSPVESLAPLVEVCSAAAPVPTVAEPEGVLIDVRTPEEHAENKIPGSVLLPLSTIEEEGWEALSPLVGDAPVVTFHCHSGMRSEQAVRLLAPREGIRLQSLQGGIVAWLASNNERD